MTALKDSSKASFAPLLSSRPGARAPGLSASGSDSLGRPRRHKPLGIGLDEREQSAIGGDEQIVVRTVRKGGRACAICIDGVRAAEGLVIKDVPVEVS